MKSSKQRFRLTRLKGGEGLRTDVIEGVALPPNPGDPFILYGNGLKPGTQRVVTTSPVVVTFPSEEETIFVTRSGSKYKLEPLGAAQ